ncbi:EVE domain-containing protein [Candidatus Uhrbacteria bacterium]|nr:EVE domain-containing protein [Candidatus Uhrbacteria bacterium]
MNHWLIKSEPSDYSWEKLEAEGEAVWDGVRNYQARNNLREMKSGDLVFFYNAGEERMVVGIAQVAGEAFPDPTAESGDWSAIKIKAVKPLNRVISLEEIRNTYGLSVMPLVSQARLTVQPVTAAQAAMLLKIGKTEV